MTDRQAGKVSGRARPSRRGQAAGRGTRPARLAGAITARPLLVALILLATLALFPPYHDAFIGDDYVQLWRVREFLERPLAAVNALDPLWTDWYYRPLQNIWILANRLLFGVDPFGFYALQAGWHALVVALVYRLARGLGMDRVAAGGGMALFAIHAWHQDVVGWISSIAIIMVAAISLLAAIAYASYLEGRPGRGWLAVTVAAGALALLAHEEGALLPIFLLGARWLGWRQKPVRRAEMAALGLLLALAVVYLAFQLSRPNLNISAQGAAPADYLAYWRPAALSHFLLLVTGRWALLGSTGWGSALLSGLAASPLLESAAGLVVLTLLAVWFRAGGRGARLGLWWAALHLAFIYLALYSQRPEFFAGRHLYNSWAGICLALAALIQRLGRWPRLTAWGSRALAGSPADWRTSFQGLVVLAAAAFLWLNAGRVALSQQQWVAMAAEMRAAERDIKAEVPSLPAGGRVFAHRFVISPTYSPAVASVWYDRPQLEGGSLARLKGQAEVDDRVYLWDYDGGALYNLMPELQQARATRLLWQPAAGRLDGNGRLSPLPESAYALDQVAARRLGVAVTLAGNEDEWSVLAYETEVSAGWRLETAFRGAAGQPFRVRLNGEIALTGAAVAGREWQLVVVELGDHNGQPVEARLEAAAGPTGAATEVFWAAPRLVTD